MFKHIKYRFDQALEKSFFNLVLFLFILSFLGIIVFAAIFYLLYLIGLVSVDGILSQYIWQTFAYFIDVGTIAGEDYGQNTIADKIFKIIITIFGIIIFSSFIGIISQALANRIEELRAGEGIVSEKNHIIIFNFTRKTIPLLSELFKAHDKEKKTIVILSDKKPNEVLSKIEGAINIPKNINLINRKGYGWQKKIPKLLDFIGASDFIFLKPDVNDEFETEYDCDNEVGKSLTSVICSKEFQKTGGNLVAEFSSKQKQELYEVYNIQKITQAIKNSKNKKSYPLFVESEDIRAKVISQAVNTPDIVEIYDEIFSYKGSEIYFIDTKNLNLEIKNKLNKLNNKDIYELNSIFDRVICLGFYNTKNENFGKQEDGSAYLNPEVLWVDINSDKKINFNEIDGLIFIASNKKEIFDEISLSEKNKDNIEDINLDLIEFNHDTNIALLADDVQDERIIRVLDNIKQNNLYKNIKLIRIYVDENGMINNAENFKTKIDEFKNEGIKLELYEVSFKNWRHEQYYPFVSISEIFNEFNSIICIYDNITDKDENINNVKDNKVLDNYILFSNFDIDNEEFQNKPRSFVTEVGAFKTKDILERHKKDIYSPFFGTDIIDINTLISKIISTGTIDNKNKKLIDLFLGATYKFKTYTINNDILETSFSELEKFFAKKKQILLGIINYDFKDVKEDFKSKSSMPRRKIREILINPDQRKRISLDKGDRMITISH